MKVLSLPLALWAASGLALMAPLSSPAPESPAVFLNHFFVVVNPESYAAMRADPYLTGTFAPFEARTTVRADMTYTGAYWYGERSYFEVFEPPSQGPPGSSGMALSVDAPRGSAAIKTAWTESLGAAETSVVTRRTETAEPTWFHITASRSPVGLRMWLMEYDRDFLARFYPNLTAARGITRAEVLERYVAKIGRLEGRERTVLRDVTGLRMALDSSDREALIKHLLPAGWKQRGGTSGLVVLDGPEGVVVEVEAASATRKGIVEARFSVRGTPAPHAATLGSVRFEVTPSGARLRFANEG